MKGEITKISENKSSYNNDVMFKRVQFRLEDGSWAKTDLVTTFRNFERWRGILERGVGAQLDGLEFKNGNAKTINADCSPILLN